MKNQIKFLLSSSIKENQISKLLKGTVIKNL